MSKVELRDRINLVRAYYQSGNSATAALRQLNKENNRKTNICSEATVRNLIQRFEELGSVEDRPRSGRPRVPEETIEFVADSTIQIQSESSIGTASCSDVAKKMSMPLSTVRKILREYLNWRPYRLQIVQELKENDSISRMQFAREMIERIDSSSSFLFSILWSDEAHFSLDGCVFTRQCIIWAPEKPTTPITKPLHSPKVTVWVGFTSEFILEPFFFEGTVNSENYLFLLQHHLVPLLKQRRKFSKTIFQQDGASPHVAGVVQTFLRENFGEERIISRSFPFAWPPRSPDVAPPDYWLWGMLKSKIYKQKPTSIEELKRVIRKAVSEISPDELKKAVQNIVPRLHALLHHKGEHFEHLM